jgi:hypothetical protein
VADKSIPNIPPVPGAIDPNLRALLQALREAAIARVLGYHCGLLSLGAWRDAC